MSEHIAELSGLKVSAFYGGSDRGRCLQFEIDGPYAQLTYADMQVLHARLMAWLLGLSQSSVLLPESRRDILDPARPTSTEYVLVQEVRKALQTPGPLADALRDELTRVARVEDSQLRLIRRAIEDFDAALARREHGGIALVKAFSRIRTVIESTERPDATTPNSVRSDVEPPDVPGGIK